jgi:hypothetical protein
MASSAESASPLRVFARTFAVTFLAAKALHLAQSHSFDASCQKRFLHGFGFGTACTPLMAGCGPVCGFMSKSLIISGGVGVGVGPR